MVSRIQELQEAEEEKSRAGCGPVQQQGKSTMCMDGTQPDDDQPDDDQAHNRDRLFSAVQGPAYMLPPWIVLSATGLSELLASRLSLHHRAQAFELLANLSEWLSGHVSELVDASRPSAASAGDQDDDDGPAHKATLALRPFLAEPCSLPLRLARPNCTAAQPRLRLIFCVARSWMWDWLAPLASRGGSHKRWRWRVGWSLPAGPADWTTADARAPHAA